MKTYSARNLLAAGIIAALAGLTGAGNAFAAEDHDHGSAAAVLQLNAGSKWETDAPLQQGMLKIRAAVEDKLPAVHAGEFSEAQYQALGGAVEQQITYIVENCKLTPAADAVLHGVIAELVDGVDVVTGKKAVSDRSQGVVHLVGALDNYGTYFAHPGWTPVNAGH